ncbi:thioredoxin-disulfide reductase [Haematospirillum jordaniae]|uniref:Thioredoxin reductase n=1 Tax=Haematospirillum jordaniae TaxID=1549855 RepID=A0A143DBD5_9PROT|nr:thioredoxin-disulfide reductase [Haematospirillum jordaniae]AMW34034.1 thioredoxin reductase [Haematospirillum jordaniae]NKD45339.1 thioredoxin-disulfide reductase [Haematospirillum jordaniae]NKD57331.1 thioredoxin-disulfide reductase [Haematospirillum jordaniae]NKD59685.1 thioredoxin-disulfide reductase [Haematospirillum jordaniae]NKD67257.1 thioredoxin-disulfide reductase [Haematospirillum jordaniae]
MTEHRTRVLILGTGAAGCTAAIYTARANLEPVVLAGLQPGGQLTITTDVENYPGFADPVQGPWLMEQMRQQAEHCGARIAHDMATSVDLSQRPFTVHTDGGDVWKSDTLIIATGASAKWLDIPSEKKYAGLGVSACATCDGFFFRGKDVVVVGGGNSAVEEALYLANICASVTVVHRRDSFRAEKILQDRLLRNPKITVRWNSKVHEILGGGNPEGVTGIRLEDTITGSLSDLACDGVFIAIGHKPNTDLFSGQLQTDENGYLVTQPDSTATSIPGVFAAGDVQDHVFRQAITAAGTGCMAALEADRFLRTDGDT